MQEKKFCPYCCCRLVKKDYEGRRRLFCLQCNQAIYENPIPAVALVVIDGKGRILLARRKMEPKKGFWSLPGGFMELGETTEEAGLRELKEETGLSGMIAELIGVATNSSSLYDTVLIIGYLVKSCTGSLGPGDDVDEVAYFAERDLPELAFESHTWFIDQYLSKT